MRRMAARSMKASRCVSTSAKYGTINASCGNEGLLSAIDDFESSGHARFPGLELTAEKSLRSSRLDHDVVNYAAVDSLTLLVNAFEREKGFEREGKVLTQLGMDLPGVEEALESEHWTHAAFYPPMILFDNIVQVGASADLDGIVPTVIELVIHTHAAQSGMGGLEAIQGNYSRLAVALESFTEERLGGGDATRSTDVGFDGFALFIW